ncbi:hypothetical protein C1645_830861 [Glomus cerebriforme]|uniref:Uncharacterized protein n=1 Tax=Glomus cerebriforme TaxID=658196 RepID=A0A397SRA6_9GLOM|nr:hypothetical protein C1645_830861 [Glomus cerebriforme]
MNPTTTFETKQEMGKQDPLFNILEKQSKQFEEFGKRMSLELQSSYQDYFKQQTEKLQKLYSGLESENNITCKCNEKDELIVSLKTRIEELEADSNIKDQNIQKLQKDVHSLFNIIVKKGIANIEEFDSIPTCPTKIMVTPDVGEELYDSESTKQEINVNKVEIEKDRLSVESIQYYDDIKDSYSDSAVDLFTDDDDYDGSSTTGDSVKTEDSNYTNKYDRPSEWLDVSPSLKQRSKFDKRNLDRWNSKMASNGLIPIKLVGKIDEEKEKKIQTHRKRYSTSAIWVKTYENKQKQDQDEKFKIPSFNFSRYTFSTTEDVKSKQKQKQKQKDAKEEFSAPISLKSSVSTSISDLYTTSLVTTSTTSLQPYELLEHHKNTPMNFSKSQQMLSQYK